jgi:hypothetical protein
MYAATHLAELERGKVRTRIEVLRASLPRPQNGEVNLAA